MTPDPAPPEALLTPDDPPAFREVPATGPAPILVVCDHATSAVPRRLGSLGLPAAELDRHIGSDLGAEAVARRLAHRLGARALLSSFARLVIDCNRELDHPGSIVAESDGTPVPGNALLSPAARRARTDEIFWPYHRAIAAALDGFEARGATPLLVSVHSFTPRLHGQHRPWHVGVLWNEDGRIAVPLLAALGRSGLTIGDNEPYSGRTPGDFTVPHHGERRGRLHAMLEIRQDEIATEEGASRYADLLGEALTPLLAP